MLYNVHISYFKPKTFVYECLILTVNGVTANKIHLEQLSFKPLRSQFKNGKLLISTLDFQSS